MLRFCCPACEAFYEVDDEFLGRKVRCENCGIKFYVPANGIKAELVNPEKVDSNKTIAPRRQSEINNSPDDRTMPGRRDRKPDGRFEVGDLIMNRYKVLSELGQGGMGVVYECFDETAGIKIALKALPPELSHNTLEMEDIKENFQLVHNLHHPNIASSNNLEKDNSNGNYYLIMECCEGEDLRRWIRRKRKEGELKLEDVLPIIKQVADALDYAHKQKIIHRDIKPGNIMIAPNGEIKVLDFGLAAQIHTSMTRVSMAYHGTSGTGPYMAPEQWRGRAQGAPADQYALAVMTYEMLAGHLPFESADPAVLQQAVLTQDAEEIPDVPQAVHYALNRAMSKEPAERFENCTDFASAMSGKKIKSAATNKKFNYFNLIKKNVFHTKDENKKNYIFSVFMILLCLIICMCFLYLIIVGLPIILPLLAIIGVVIIYKKQNSKSNKKDKKIQIDDKESIKIKKKSNLGKCVSIILLLSALVIWINNKQEYNVKEIRREKVETTDKLAEEKRKEENAKAEHERLAYEKAIREKLETADNLEEAKRKEENAKAEHERLAYEKAVREKLKKNLTQKREKEVFNGTITLKNGIKIEMVKIKAGTFMMGSPESELSQKKWRGELSRYHLLKQKQNRVTLTKDYWMGKYEVTQAQYEAIMKKNPSHFRGSNRPVEEIRSWDAHKFCQKLNKLCAEKLPAGYKFDLPSEAQWEYACRAKSTTALNNGTNLTSETGFCKNLDKVAWYNKNSSRQTHPIGQKHPNKWGLYDMHGNVWEWCSDGVRRGGSWNDEAWYCRSASQSDFNQAIRGGSTGFRLALVPIQ